MIVSEASLRQEDAAHVFGPEVEPQITPGGLTLLSDDEVTFIQTHQQIVVKAMKPYLVLADRFLASGYPVNRTPPIVTGTGTVGQTLSCTTGTWLNSPSFTYQWYAAGVAISGATAATRVLAAGESGKTVSCIVTGTAAGQAVPAASNGIAVA
jgi:hypothetical protein